MNKDISIVFLGQLVPDTKEFQNIALTRAGNMVQDGFVNGLHKQEVEVTVFSLRPIASFPKNNTVFSTKKTIKYKGAIKLILIPFVNILILKTITSMVSDFFLILNWAVNNRKKERYIIVYNAADPPLPFVYWMGKLTGSKSVAILYDLGMPPKELQLSSLKKLIYRFLEIFAKKYIPRLNGRIVINENIARDYAPGKDFLLIDGGISRNIIERLFELDVKKNKDKTIFVLAGSLWGANGTKLIVETLQKNKNPKIEMWFAGWGQDEDYIINATEEDQRIKYKGNLDLDQLFDLYKEADVLMNIRVTDDREGDYLFPSKFLEYLTVGKYVITTKVAHIEKEYGHLCKVLKNNTSDELSAAMDELTNMAASELVKKGLIARQYMLENHTWDNQTSKIIEYITS